MTQRNQTEYTQYYLMQWREKKKKENAAQAAWNAAQVERRKMEEKLIESIDLELRRNVAFASGKKAGEP